MSAVSAVKHETRGYASPGDNNLNRFTPADDNLNRFNLESDRDLESLHPILPMNDGERKKIQIEKRKGGSAEEVERLLRLNNSLTPTPVGIHCLIDEADYHDTLECAALLPDLEVFAEKDDTKIGDRGVTISGGQRARVAIARSIYDAKSADIFVFDDVLSAVDTHVAEHLRERLFRPAESGGERGGGESKSKSRLGDKCVILATHDQETMRMSSWIVYVEPRTDPVDGRELPSKVHKFRGWNEYQNYLYPEKSRTKGDRTSSSKTSSTGTGTDLVSTVATVATTADAAESEVAKEGKEGKEEKKGELKKAGSGGGEEEREIGEVKASVWLYYLKGLYRAAPEILIQVDAKSSKSIWRCLGWIVLFFALLFTYEGCKVSEARWMTYWSDYSSKTLFAAIASSEELQLQGRTVSGNDGGLNGEVLYIPHSEGDPEGDPEGADMNETPDTTHQTKDTTHEETKSVPYKQVSKKKREEIYKKGERKLGKYDKRLSFVDQ